MKPRLDRLISLYMVSPYLKLLSEHDRSVPILMYHSITDQDETNEHPYYRTTTTPAIFATHLKYLQEEGYASCTLAHALDYLQSGPSVRTKLVAITFDDGYGDFMRHAFPLLHQYGFSATVFLPTAYIGDDPVSFKGKDCLTWKEVRELSTNGIVFGSHTVTHPQLRELSFQEIRDEVLNSKHTIEQSLGTDIDAFAYPYAFPQTDSNFREALRNLLSEAGYKTGVCTVVGRARRRSDPFFLERLPMNSSDDSQLLGVKLAGAYDWVSRAQHISKLIRSRSHGFKSWPKPLISKELPRVQRPS